MLHHPPLVDPPLSPLLSFLSLRSGLPFPLCLRLPAILGYGLLLLSVYYFVRKWVGPPVAFLASTLLLIMPAFQFAIQARPYAILLGFSGLALLCWQRAAAHSRRALTLAGLYLSITCAILSHYLGALILFPLVAGELWRSFRLRRPDCAVWGVIAAGCFNMLLYIPFLPAAAEYRAYPWHGVLTSDLGETYLLAVGPAIIVLITFCSLIRIAYADARPFGTTFRGYELVSIGALYGVPILAFVAAKFITHQYVPRYSVIFVIAATALLAAVIRCLTISIPGLTSGLGCLMLVYASSPAIHGLKNREPQDVGQYSRSSIPILQEHPGVPIAVAGFDPYVRFRLFTNADVWERMTVVSARSDVKSLGPDVSIATEAAARALGQSAVLYGQFILSNRQFLVLGDFWFRNRLVRDGWQVTLIGSVFGSPLYRAQSAAFKEGLRVN